MSELPKLTNPFNSRITRHGDERVEDLLYNPLNFRIHPGRQQEALTGSIDNIGFIRSILINERTGRIIDGHLRALIAARSGVEWIPAEYVYLTEDEEALALASIDPIAEMATDDRDKLSELLSRIDLEADPRLETMIAEISKKAGIDFTLPGEEIAAPEAKLTRAEELRDAWKTEPGQLWELGSHRLIIGDVLDPRILPALLGDDRPDMLWTDPPYNVAYTGNYIYSGHVVDSRSMLWGDGIDNDALSDDFPGWLASVFLRLDGYLKEGAPVYICHPNGSNLRHFVAAFPFDLWHFQTDIVWDKGSIIVHRWDYKPRHEGIFYGWKGKNRVWEGPSNESSVWEIPRDHSGDFDHPTEKPPELVQRSIKNHASRLLLDPFLGSGAALVASERLSIACRGVELSPQYAAITLQRWREMTQRVPTLIESHIGEIGSRSS